VGVWGKEWRSQEIAKKREQCSLRRVVHGCKRKQSIDQSGTTVPVPLVTTMGSNDRQIPQRVDNDASAPIHKEAPKSPPQKETQKTENTRSSATEMDIGKPDGSGAGYSS